MKASSSISTARRKLFGVRRYSSVELLAALILLFIVSPFIEDLPKGDLIESVFMTLVLVSAVLAVGGRRRTLVFSIALLTPALACKWLSQLHPPPVPPQFHLVFGLGFIAFVVANLLRFIMRAPRVDTEVLCAAISTYLMLGLFWTLAYTLVGQISPAAFSFSGGPEASHTMNGFNAFYFSFATLSTVGYGDIAPVSKFARMLAVMEAIFGMFYVAMLISRLVAMYAPKDRDQSPTDSQ